MIRGEEGSLVSCSKFWARQWHNKPVGQKYPAVSHKTEKRKIDLEKSGNQGRA